MRPGISMPVEAPLRTVMPNARAFRVKSLHGGRHGNHDNVLLGADGGADAGDRERVRDEADDDVDLRHLDYEVEFSWICHMTWPRTG